jgi:hypothetical protein
LQTNCQRKKPDKIHAKQVPGMRQRVAAEAQIQQMPKELMLTDINTDFPGIYVIARLGRLSILNPP